MAKMYKTNAAVGQTKTKAVKWVAAARRYLLYGFTRLWRRLWLKGMKPENRFAGWVARLTLVLCLIGALQAWIFFQSERGILQPYGIALTPNPVISAHNQLIIDLAIKNGGKGVVVVVGGAAKFAVPMEPLPASPDYRGGLQPWQMIILPGEGAHLIAVPKNGEQVIKFEDSDIEGIRTGKLNLWFFGYITYRDRLSAIFGQQTVGYCYHYNPSMGTDPNAGMFVSCGSDAYVYIRRSP
jgi:hypothetical protein